MVSNPSIKYNLTINEPNPLKRIFLNRGPIDEKSEKIAALSEPFQKL